MTAWQIVRSFEKEVSRYTGAPHVVAVNSCTNALLLALRYFLRQHPGPEGQLPEVEIPRRTYVSVPQSIIHAGGVPVYRDEKWEGCYQLRPFPVYDCAREFTFGMYEAGTLQCVSFHTTKVLGDTQGGAILLDDPDKAAWLRRMRYDGRTEGVAPKDDEFHEPGYHCMMSPDVAARLWLRLGSLPSYNPPLPWDDYPDLSKINWEL